MSNINKQELREAAERAESDSWGYDRDEFNEALTPSTVLALLDELEAKDSMIAAQQHEIRTLLNALEGRPCPKCNDTGMADSGGTGTFSALNCTRRRTTKPVRTSSPAIKVMSFSGTRWISRSRAGYSSGTAARNRRMLAWY